MLFLNESPESDWSLDELESLPARITELEIRWMQVQQDFDALNSVVIAQQADIQAMRAILGRFEARLDTLSDPEPPRDPVAEQPPHY